MWTNKKESTDFLVSKQKNLELCGHFRIVKITPVHVQLCVTAIYRKYVALKSREVPVVSWLLCRSARWCSVCSLRRMRALIVWMNPASSDIAIWGASSRLLMVVLVARWHCVLDWLMKNYNIIAKLVISLFRAIHEMCCGLPPLEFISGLFGRDVRTVFEVQFLGGVHNIPQKHHPGVKKYGESSTWIRWELRDVYWWFSDTCFLTLVVTNYCYATGLIKRTEHRAKHLL